MNIYTLRAHDALDEVLNCEEGISAEAAKAAIMKQTMLMNYEEVVFWCGVPLPYQETEWNTNKLKATELAQIFDNMDDRFTSWATPPRRMFREMEAEIRML